MKSAGSARGFVGEKKTMPPPTAPPSIVAQSNANTDFLKMLQGANNETNSRTTFTNTNRQAIPPGKTRGKRRISFGGGGSVAGGSGHGIGGGSGRSIDSGGSNSATGGANAGSNTPKLSQSDGIFFGKHAWHRASPVGCDTSSIQSKKVRNITHQEQHSKTVA